MKTGKKKKLLHEQAKDLTIQESSKPATEVKRKGWGNIIFFCVALILLIYPRVMPFKDYLVADKIIFRDPDTVYHARRILYVATHSMRLPFRDPLLAHPDGAVPVWSPLYDWVSALPSNILSSGNPSENLVLKTAMLLTVLFGLMQLYFAGMLLYKATKNITIGILSAFLVGMSSPVIRYTSLEILDHNSALLLLFTYGLYRTYLLLQNANESGAVPEIVRHALIIALLFWVWPGSFLYIAILAGASVLYIIVRRNIWLCGILVKAYMLSSILVIPLALMHYRFNKDIMKFEFVSFFAVIFLIAIALLFFLLKSIFELILSHHNRIALIKTICSLALLAIIAIIVIRPLLEGMQFAQAQNRWLSTIIESEPLFFLKAGSIIKFTLGKATSNLSYLIILFPIAFVLILARKIQTPLALVMIILVSSLVTGILMTGQQKFLTEFSIPFGITLSVFIEWIMKKISNQIETVIIIVVLVAMMTALIPSSASYQNYFAAQFAYYHAYRWLKEDAHANPVEINSDSNPEYGTMTPWDLGHHLHLYSNMPTTADNFVFIFLDKNPWQGFYDMARLYLAHDEQVAINIMNKYHCKYLLVTEVGHFEKYPVLINENPDDYLKVEYVQKNGEDYEQTWFKDKFLDSVGYRLSRVYGSANAGSESGKAEFKALKHFRLVYELPGPEITGQPMKTGSLKIYTYTKGYELKIPLAGNSFYELMGLIITNTGNRFFYRQEGYANEGIIVPYPTIKEKDYPFAGKYKVSLNNTLYEFNNVQ